MKIQYTLNNPDKLKQAILNFLNLKSLDLMSQVDESELASELFKLGDTYKKQRDQLRLLKKLKKTRTWSPEWVIQIKEIYKNYNLKLELTENQPTEPAQVDKLNSKNESFMEYFYPKIKTIRKELELHPLKNHNPVITEHACFDRLNFKKGIDAIYNDKDTYYVNEKVLTSHATCLMLDQYETNILDAIKVYRRETTDKTHLCEFTHLEYHKKALKNKPIEELKEDLLYILQTLGLDASKISFKGTTYPYVCPGFEIWYTIKDKSLEIGGCGVMRSKIYPTQDTYLAAGIGLDRCFMLIKGYETISQVHPHLI